MNKRPFNIYLRTIIVLAGYLFLAVSCSGGILQSNTGKTTETPSSLLSTIVVSSSDFPKHWEVSYSSTLIESKGKQTAENQSPIESASRAISTLWNSPKRNILVRHEVQPFQGSSVQISEDLFKEFKGLQQPFSMSLPQLGERTDSQCAKVTEATIYCKVVTQYEQVLSIWQIYFDSSIVIQDFVPEFTKVIQQVDSRANVMKNGINK